MSRVRWSSRDKHFGPFLFARYEKGLRLNELSITSGGGGGDDEEEHSGCHLRLQLRGNALICDLPPIIKPVKAPVFNNAGVEIYTEWWVREYGIIAGDDEFVHIRYGQQTFSSDDTRLKTITLPWLAWESNQRTAVDRHGNESAVLMSDNSDDLPEGFVTTLQVKDYDGTVLTATITVYDIMFTRGTGWCSWLRHITRPKQMRRINIVFSDEVGTGKGTYKGGVIELSTTAELSDSHLDAFQRYCNENNLSIVYPNLSLSGVTQ